MANLNEDIHDEGDYYKNRQTRLDIANGAVKRFQEKARKAKSSEYKKFWNEKAQNAQERISKIMREGLVSFNQFLENSKQ